MINVRLEDGSVRSFPDGTSEADMLQALAPAPAAPPPPVPEAPGIGAGMQFLTQFGQAAATAPLNALSYLTSFLPPNQDRWSIRNMADVAAREMQSMYTPFVAEPKGTAEKVASLLGNALGSMTGPLAVAPAGVPGFLASTFLPTAGQERLQALDLGASEAQAKAQGAVSGALETATELFMGKIGNVVGPMKLAGVKPVDMLTEGAGEMVSSLGSDLSAAYLTKTDPSRAEGMAGRAAESFAAGVLGAAAFAPVQRAVVNEQRSLLRNEVKDLTAQLRADPGNLELQVKLIASQEALRKVLAEDAPRDPAKLAKKMGLEDVEFSTERRPNFVPLVRNEDGTLSGYGAVVAPDGTTTGDITDLDSLKMAAVDAGLTTLNGEDISQVKPSYTTASANLATGKVVVNPSGLTEAELIAELLEERTHLLLNRTPEGRAILDTFWKTRKLTDEERAALDLYKKRAQDTDETHTRRLQDEFLAKLERPGWLRKRSAELVAQVKDTFGMELTNAQAGRLLLRNLRRVPVPASGPVQGVVEGRRESRLGEPALLWRNAPLATYRDRVTPEATFTSPDKLYRAMSEEEYSKAVGRGYIQSDNRDSFPGEGTNFAERWEDARGYAYVVGSDRSDPAVNPKVPPAIIVEIPRDKRLPARDGYYKLQGPIPVSAVSRVWRLYGDSGSAYAQEMPNPSVRESLSDTEQVKSAIGNKGTFDVTNPDIRESLSSDPGFRSTFGELDDGDLRFSIRTDPPPAKTITAYKLMRVRRKEPGKLFPLFANPDVGAPLGVWLDADVATTWKGGNHMAPRPGWHLADSPAAFHIGKQRRSVDPASTEGRPTDIVALHPDTVWVEAEVAADVDWQPEALRRARRDAAGKPVAVTADIRDEIPKDGYYRYKTNPNMVGDWIVSGAIRLVRVLSDPEARALASARGVTPLPRFGGDINLSDYGFESQDMRESLSDTEYLAATFSDTDTGAYHYGDGGIGRDTTFRRMDGGRSTGHFGTGVYFLGKKESGLGREDRPIKYVDLAGLNLARPLGTLEARLLHEGLRDFNRAVYRETPIRFDQVSDVGNRIVFNLRLSLSLVKHTESDVKKAVSDVFEIFRSRQNDGLRSPSTYLMQALGYDGIDVRGTQLDDTMYGSVVFVKPGLRTESQDIRESLSEWSSGYDVKRVWHGTTTTREVPTAIRPGEKEARARRDELYGRMRRMASDAGLPEGSTQVFDRLARLGTLPQTTADEYRRLAEEYGRLSDQFPYEPTRETFDFESFRMPEGENELGAHFGNEGAASTFGPAFPFYIRAKRWLRLPDLGTWNYQSVLREARKRGVSVSEDEYTKVFNSTNPNQALRELLVSKGVDGIVYKNEAEGRGDSYIVLKPENIKSANENTGAFAESDQVRESLSDTEAARDAAWLDAVNSEDLATASKLVKRAAYEAGYTIGPVWRGESSGERPNKYERGRRREPGIFTTFDRDIAATYDSDREPRSFYVAGPVLDLYSDTPQARRWIERWAKDAGHVFVDRTSGETVSATEAVQGGNLWDWEGNWSSRYWKDLQQTARDQGYGVIFLPDYDSSVGLFKSVVVLKEENLKSADPVTYDDAGYPILPSQRFNAASQDIRESLTQYDLNELTRDIPGTKLVLGQNSNKITAQNDGSYLVDPSVKKSRLRSYLILAKAEQGIQELPVDFIRKYINRVDPTHAGDPHQWLASRFRKHYERGLLKALFDYFRLLLPGEKMRAERAFARLLDTIASEPGEFKTKYTGAESAQALANAHGPVLEQFRSVIYPLRARASKIDELAWWNEWKRNLEQELTKLRDDFRAPRTGAEQAELPGILDDEFLPYIVQDTPENREKQAWLKNMRAIEQYVDMLRNLDELNARYETLRQFGLGESTAGEIERLLGRMNRLNERVNTSDFLDRAVEHRALQDAQVDARAARSALANNPILAGWDDVVTATEESVLVRGEDGQERYETRLIEPDTTSIPKSTLDNAKIEYYFSRQKIQDEAEETQVSLGDRVRKKLAELKKALKAKGIQKAEKDIAAAEILEAAAGLEERSGRVESRETAEHIRGLKAQAAELAMRMAQAGYDRATVAEWHQSPETLRVLATELGFNETVLGELLRLMDQSPSFKNAVMTVRDRADALIRNDPLTIIEQLEETPEEDRPEILRPALRRLRNSSLRLSEDVNRIEKEIEGLEQELADLQAVYELFGQPDSRILAELRAGNDVTALRNQRDSDQDSATAVERVVYQSKEGWVFRGFLGQPDLVIGPSQPFTKALLGKVVAWREQARDAYDYVPGYVQRGIMIGDRIAQMFLNENFTTEDLHKTLMPNPFLETFARSPFGWKGLLPTLVPGLYGGLLQDRLRNVADATSAKNGVEARYIEPMYRAVTRAMESLGLSRRKLNDVLLFQSIRNEASHRLRAFGSGVEEGQALWSAPGKEITVELLALIRLDAKLGRDARAIDARRPYAGVRLGERIVRPSGETGDVGLARLADRDILERLVEAYQGNEEARRAWWSGPYAQNALRFHVFDADRNDTLIKRDSATRTKEIELKRRMTPEMLRELVTVEDWARAIGITTEQLMAELNQYYEIAQSRLKEGNTDPITQTGMFTSVSDKTEFTSPAAKLAFPSSWYDYGSSTGLKGFLNRTVDTANVELLQTFADTEKYLNQVVARIEANQIDVGEMQWVLGTTRTQFDESDRKKAISAYRAKANFVRAQRETAVRSRSRPAMDRVLRAMHRFGIAPTLATLSAMVQNIAGAGVSSYLTLAPTVGPVGAALLTPFMIGGAVLHGLVDVLHTSSVALAPVPESDANMWLLEQGLGVSYMKQFEAEREAVERGKVAGSRLGAGWDESVRLLSSTLGTVRGDQINNRFAVRVLVPLTILALKFKGANTPESREFLAGLGIGTPEEAAQKIANLPMVGFWRTDDGAALAKAIVREYNAPSTANRPEGGGYFSLLGWTAFTVGSMLKTFRRTPDQSRLRYLKPLVAGVTVAIISDIARTVALDESKTFIRYLAETLLAMLPEDDDDEEGWFESLVGVLGIYRILHATESVASTPPKLQPWDKSWREQDPLTIAADLSKRAAGGIGVNDFSLPVLSIGSNAFSGLFQMGRGLIDTGATDIKAGARRAFGLAGFYGRILGETLVPGGRPGYEAQADIVAAAQASGIPVTARPFQSSFLSATPFRREMLDIGFRLLQNDPNAEADLAKLRERIETRARTRAAKTGADQDEAAEAAVNSMVVSLDPYRNAIGRSISKEEYEKLRALAGPKAERVSRARDAIVRALRIKVTPAMRSPIRKQKGVGKPKRVRL